MTRHDPTHYTTGRHGCWVTCTCGWRSATWTSVVGAELNFGRHLTATQPTAALAETAREIEES